MSRNKRLISLACAFALIFGHAAAVSELISPDQIRADQVNYKTGAAEYGSLTKTISATGYEYYPVASVVRYRGDAADFVEYLVKRGDEVRAGDPLAVATVNYDRADMAERELRLTRARQAYEEGRQARQREISAARASLDAETDAYARQIAGLMLERREIELKQYIYQQEYALEAQQRQLDELEARHSGGIICAPCDGTVIDTVYFRPGDKLTDGTLVCRIERQDVMLVAVSSDSLRCGMTVRVTAGVSKNQFEVTGRVVAAADCVEDLDYDFALIELDPFEAPERFSWKNIKVTADTVRLDNILLIPRRAAKLETGKYTITRLTADGVTQKRFITVGLYNSEYMWVLQGLDEGDAVIID